MMIHTALLAPRIKSVGSPVARAAALETIVDAFEGDPASRSLYPEVAAFRRHFPRFVELFAGSAQADLDADGLGAALWLSPGSEPDPEPLLAHLEATLAPKDKGPILAGIEVQSALHPHAPHWYLPFVGVRPEAQGLGLGSALLAVGLARADRDIMPAYLEATSRRSMRLYRRHGFEVLGTVEMPGYPEIFAMWRPVRPAAA